MAQDFSAKFLELNEIAQKDDTKNKHRDIAQKFLMNFAIAVLHIEYWPSEVSKQQTENLVVTSLTTNSSKLVREPKTGVDTLLKHQVVLGKMTEAYIGDLNLSESTSEATDSAISEENEDKDPVEKYETINPLDVRFKQFFLAPNIPYYLSRHIKNDIVIGDRMISKRHLVFHAKDNTVFVTDLRSSNGTYINNNTFRIEDTYKLKNKDIIRIPQVVMQVQLLHI